MKKTFVKLLIIFVIIASPWIINFFFFFPQHYTYIKLQPIERFYGFPLETTKFYKSMPANINKNWFQSLVNQKNFSTAYLLPFSKVFKARIDLEVRNEHEMKLVPKMYGAEVISLKVTDYNGSIKALNKCVSLNSLLISAPNLEYNKFDQLNNNMSDLIFLKPASGNDLNLTKLKSLKNLTFLNYEDSSFLPILSVFDQLEEVDINGLDVSSRSINSISTKIIRLDELTIKEDIFIQDVNWQALVIERTKGEGKIFFKNLIQLKKVRVNEYDKHVDYQSLFNQPNLETIYIKDEDFLQKLLKHDNIQNPILTIKYLRFEVSESDKEILKKRFKRVEKLNPKKEVFF